MPIVKRTVPRILLEKVEFLLKSRIYGYGKDTLAEFFFINKVVTP